MQIALPTTVKSNMHLESLTLNSKTPLTPNQKIY